MFCKYVRVQGDKILDLSHETFLPKGTAWNWNDGKAD
jgi:hypothetical protein